MTFRWGTVTAVSPLRVRLDGDTSALPFTPDSLVDPLSLLVNDRVRCEVAVRRALIVGAAGGVSRTTTVFRRTTGAMASTTSHLALPIATNLLGSAFTHSSGVFTCQVEATYKIDLLITYALNTTGVRGARLSASVGGNRNAVSSAANSGVSTTVPLSFVLPLSVGTTVTAEYLQSSGGNLVTVAEIVFERLT